MMKVLKVYDTMQRARFEAEEHYQEWLNCEMNICGIMHLTNGVGLNLRMG